MSLFGYSVIKVSCGTSVFARLSMGTVRNLIDHIIRRRIPSQVNGTIVCFIAMAAMTHDQAFRPASMESSTDYDVNLGSLALTIAIQTNIQIAAPVCMGFEDATLAQNTHAWPSRLYPSIEATHPSQA